MAGSVFGGRTGGNAGSAGNGGNGGDALGGAVYFASGTFTAANSTFEGDSVTGGDGGSGGSGGDGGMGGDVGDGVTGFGGNGGNGGGGVQGGAGGNGQSASPFLGPAPDGGYGGAATSGGVGGNGGKGAGGAFFIESGTVVLISPNVNDTQATGGAGWTGGAGGRGGPGGDGGWPGLGGGGGGGSGGWGNDSIAGPQGTNGSGADGTMGGRGGNPGTSGDGGTGGAGGDAFGGSLYQQNGSVFLFGGSFSSTTATGGAAGAGGYGGVGGQGGAGGTGGEGGTCAQVPGGNGGGGGVGANAGNGGNGGNAGAAGNAYGGAIYVQGTQTISISGTTLDGTVQGGAGGTIGQRGAGGYAGTAGIPGAAGGGGDGTDGGKDGEPGPAGGSGQPGQTGATSPDGEGQGLNLFGGNVVADTQAPTVSLMATNVSSQNANSETPYSFTLTFTDDTFVSASSIAASTVQVQPPSGPALTATLINTVPSGTEDGLGDAQTITATYQIVPPSGNWTGADNGVYSINLGSNVSTDLASNAVPPGSVGTFQVTIDVAPAIIDNPSNQTVTASQLATFTASASGTPSPTVQWQVSTDGGATFKDISGATSITLTLSNVAADMNGDEYQAVFTNSAGSATTSVAALTVQFAPTVTSNPNSQTVTAGQNASFTAAANANPAATVQWQVSTDGGKNFTNISGATSTTLTLTNVSGSLNDNEYRAVFTNSAGSANTNAATLIIQTVPVVISGNSATFTVGQGGSFTVAALASPTPTLTESGALPSGVSFTDNGSGTATLSGTPSSGTNGTYHFTITAQNAAGSITQNFTLTVNPASVPPSPTAPPAPPTLNEPPLLAFFDSLLAGSLTVNADGTETVTDSFFGIPLLVSNFDSSGNLMSVDLFGFIDITTLFLLL